MRRHCAAGAGSVPARKTDAAHRPRAFGVSVSVIAGSILLFPIGLLFLLLQGGDVTLEDGAGLTATVVG